VVQSTASGLFLPAPYRFQLRSWGRTESPKNQNPKERCPPGSELKRAIAESLLGHDFRAARENLATVLGLREGQDQLRSHRHVHRIEGAQISIHIATGERNRYASPT